MDTIIDGVRKSAICICATLVVATGVLVFSRLAGGSEQRMPVPEFLLAPAAPEDNLPSEFTEFGGYSEIDDVTTSRFVGTAQSRRIFIALGRGDEICIVATSGEGKKFIAAVSCQPRSRFSTQPLAVAFPNADSTMDIVALSLAGLVSIQGGDSPEKSTTGNFVAILESSDSDGCTVTDEIGSVEIIRES